MIVRLRATENFDFEQMTSCDVTLDVLDDNNDLQGWWLKLFSILTHIYVV